MRKKVKLTEDEKKLMIARAFFQTAPFATKVYVCLKTKLDMSFVSKNWDKITE